MDANNAGYFSTEPKNINDVIAETMKIIKTRIKEAERETIDNGQIVCSTDARNI